MSPLSGVALQCGPGREAEPVCFSWPRPLQPTEGGGGDDAIFLGLLLVMSHTFPAFSCVLN